MILQPPLARRGNPARRRKSAALERTGVWTGTGPRFSCNNPELEGIWGKEYAAALESPANSSQEPGLCWPLRSWRPTLTTLTSAMRSYNSSEPGFFTSRDPLAGEEAVQIPGLLLRHLI